MVVFCVSTAFNSRSSIAPIPPALRSTTFATLGLMDDHQGALWAATWQRGASAPFMAVLRRTPLRMVWRTITSFALMRTAAVRFGFFTEPGAAHLEGREDCGPRARCRLFHGLMKLLGRPKVFAQLIRQTFRKKWVVYAKRPFGGPEHALRYLGCYTRRVAISNHRLVSFANDQVTFRWRDSAHHNKKRVMTLHVNEFLRRFLLHVLPPGFVRIRHFGFLSTRKRSTLLPLCFRLLGANIAESETEATSTSQQSQPRVAWLCPHCHGPMLILERCSALQLRFRAPPLLSSTAA